MANLKEKLRRLYKQGCVWSETTTSEHDDAILLHTIMNTVEGLIATSTRDEAIVTEICGRWNTFPAMYGMLRKFFLEGPVEVVNGKCFVPKVGSIMHPYICWFCGAMEGEKHDKECIYVELTQYFNHYCGKHFVED